MVRRIISNSGILIIEKLFSMASTLLITVLMTRYLNIEDWGTLSYCLALVGLVSPLAALGLNSLISKELIDGVYPQAKIMGTAIFLRMFGAFLGAISLIFFSKFFFVSNDELMYVISLSIGSLFLSLTGVSFYFESLVLAKYVSIARTFAIVISFVIKLAAIYYQAEFKTIIFIFSCDFVFQGVFLLLAYSYHANDITKWRFDWSLAKSLLSKSYWLIFSSLCAVLYLKVDQVMLGKLTSMEEVGYYALAAKFSEVWYFIPNAIMASCYPILIKVKSKSIVDYNMRLQQTCDILFLLSLSLAIFIQLFSPWIITHIFGVAYEKVTGILIIHIWASIFVFMRAVASKWLIVEGLLKYSLWSQGIGAIVNITFNAILIPSYGAIGASYATIISYAFASWFAFYIYKDTRLVANMMLRSFLIPYRLIKKLCSLFRSYLY
ncbi:MULTISPECIES: flippase [Shewanella]|uniref:flippase n=1 Tax=Shewanella TaxID=22 RepID=UPI0018E2FF4B|nr:flippase [Shewanella algae]MBO2640748.1 flippase [Shewanella algae]